ncbi:hypothetical protein ANCCAN_16568 [Ancylostoma caninum]|uniref:Uncharacterized protein n=1 Tax=Ancylostoma caninum TaxID=29170 RepID=A0A368FZ72_ANCCA|nr:hypothetical protein ANCCAN_16568 [Ancylostoma caninum]
MDWPTCSSDLNSMENLLSILARSVYCSHRQCQTIDELKTTTINTWEDVESDFFKNLINSMLNLFFEVVSNPRGPVAY